MSIFNAIERGDLAAVRSLLAGDRKLAGTKDAAERRPLHAAAEQGDPDLVALLLAHGARPDVKDRRKRTPLHLAIESAHAAAAHALVAAGAAPADLQQPKMAPLHGWLETGNEPAVRLFLELGADPNHVLHQYGQRRAPLHALAASGHTTLTEDCRLRMARLLLERGADPNSRAEDEKTPLHLAAEQGHREVLAVLLDHGADLEARDAEGGTPLYYAVGSADLYAVELLLERGANPQVQASDGKTPLDYARDYFGFRYIARAVAAAMGRASPEPMGKSRPGEFLCACKKGYLELARRIIRDDPNVVHTRGSVGLIHSASPLHVAAMFGQAQIARLLLEHGHPVDAVDQWGATPLMEAGKMGHAEVARVLLGAGAQVNARDAHQSTALHEAAYPRAGTAELVQLLLEAGADPNARDQNNTAPVDRARGYLGHPMFAEHEAETERAVRLLQGESSGSAAAG